MNDALPSHVLIRFGVFELDTESGELRKQGVRIRLQEQPFQILQVLLEHPGKIVTREELQRRIWPSDTFVDFDTGLYNAIKRLREALGDSADAPRFIETLSRRGYRFIAGVNGSGGATSIETLPLANRPRTSRNLRVGASLGIGTAILLATVLGLGTFWQRLSSNASAPQIRSIAVLPLENLSGDPAQEYFSDGMTDALITDLAQISSLKVISRTSSMQYKQTKKSLPDIARELNVDGIVEGTVQRSGDRVRITAQLIRGTSDRHLWANSYERNMGDVFALERDVTEDIAHQVRARLTPDSQKIPPQTQPTNLNALEAYLQGNYHLNKYGRGSGVEEARKAAEYFQQAIDSDPNFAPAYLGIAHAHGGLPLESHGDLATKRRAEEKALQLDPNSPEAQLIQANNKWSDLDWAGAEQEFRRVIALSPNNAGAHAELCSLIGERTRLDEALTECQIAQELDPNNDHLSEVLYLRGDYDRAIAIRRIMVERHPDDGSLHYGLSQFYAQKGMYKESVEELAKTSALLGNSDASGKIRRAFSDPGYQGAMRQAAKELEHLHATQQMFAPVNLADVYASLGEKDRALYWLEKAVEHRDMIEMGFPADYLGVDPMLVSLRSDPRFKDLLQRLGLPDIQSPGQSSLASSAR